MYHGLVSTKIWNNTTVFNIDDKNHGTWESNQHFRMISEGSCDTFYILIFHNITILTVVLIK